MSLVSCPFQNNWIISVLSPTSWTRTISNSGKRPIRPRHPLLDNQFRLHRLVHRLVHRLAKGHDCQNDRVCVVVKGKKIDSRFQRYYS